MSFLGGGLPQWLVQVKMGVPHDGGIPWARDGVSPHQGWVLPLWIGQQMEYLIRRGRYTSCVHAGGLSCSGFDFIEVYSHTQKSEIWFISAISPPALSSATLFFFSFFVWNQVRRCTLYLGVRLPLIVDITERFDSQKQCNRTRLYIERPPSAMIWNRILHLWLANKFS